MNFNFLHPADQLIMIMNRIYENGLTTTSGGNLSIKDSDGVIWITPSSIDKGTLTRDDIVKVLPDGKVEHKHRPSCELPFHTLVYKTRPDVHAIVHAHPPALVSFSLLKQIPNTKIIPTPYKICGNVGRAGYEIPGSIKLGNNIAVSIANGSDVVMMDNHGVVAVGESIYDAFMKFETLENCAVLQLQSAKLGQPYSLTEEQIEDSQCLSVPTLAEFEPSERTSFELEARRIMTTLVKRSYRHKLITSTQGTFSQKLEKGDTFVITPYGKDRSYIEEQDFVLVENGKREKGKTPSRSVKLNRMIYNAHPDVKSIIIAYPANVMAFGITRTELNSRTIPESYINMRDVVRLPFGSCTLNPKAIVAAISAKSPLVLVENDCLIVTGASLINCFDRLEVAEFTANTLITAGQLGTITPMDSIAIDDINSVFKLPN